MALPPSFGACPSEQMAQIHVGDVVFVQGLMNHRHYNGCRGVATKLDRGDPDVKCEIQIDVMEGHLEEKRLRLKMGNLLTPRPIESMVWRNSSSQAAFHQIWVQRIQEQDPVGLQLGNGDVWLYIILQLATQCDVNPHGQNRSDAIFWLASL